MSLPPPYRLALATYLAEPDLSADDARLVPALAEAGIGVMAVPWNAPAMDWRSVDAVLLRSTWDYVEHHAAFLDWVRCLPVPVFNGADTVAWNSDKRYLGDLARAGVRVVATGFAEGRGLPDLLAVHGAATVIVKPAVSASARDTLRGRADDPGFRTQVAALAPDRPYLVQPYVREIESAGEWSLIYLDGVFSHAVLKRPAAGDFRVQSAHGGTVAPAPADPGLRTQGQAVLEALVALGQPLPLYARVDGIVVGGRFVLMELELIEPALHWHADAQAPTRLARAVRARLDAIRQTPDAPLRSPGR